MDSIAVVVGNYRGEHLLGDCLASLERQTRPPSEVFVVDGGSPDQSVAVARALGATVREEENRGLGYLYNRGAESARGDLVLFANNDVALAGDCLERLGDALAADGERFAADPRQVDWDGERTVHARTTIRRGGLLRELIPGLRLEHVVPSAATVPTVCANGAAMLVRREWFLQLGGFDETFFMEWEDLDLCWRAWLRGWATVYVPEAVVRHRVGAATTPAEVHRRVASSHHNLLRFALKCLPPAAAGRVLAGELLRVPRRPRAALWALIRVARELPEIRGLRAAAAPRGELYEWMLAGQPSVGEIGDGSSGSGKGAVGALG